jgi:hypothetical protein
MANSSALAAIVAVGVVLLHLRQVPLLSGSLREFWARNDANARISKLLFGLRLCACFLVAFVPSLGIVCAAAFMAVSLGLGMDEWKG